MPDPLCGAAPSRRSLLLIAGAAGTGLVAATGCSNSTRRPQSPRPADSRSASTQPSAHVASLDAELRSRAIGDERRLFAACAGPGGVEPFATLRTLHAAHLDALSGNALTGRSEAEPVPSTPSTDRPTLALAERSAAQARRRDCLAASPSLAPLLASIAADGDAAIVLLSS